MTDTQTRQTWDRTLGTAATPQTTWFDLVASNHPLTWPVSKVELETITPEHKACKDLYAVANRNPMTQESKILAVVGKQATIALPETAWEVGQTIIANANDVFLRSYGTMHQNRQWFFTFDRAPMRIGDHVVENMITAMGSFDGSLKYTISHGSVIAICTNQAGLIKRVNEMICTFKHTLRINDRIEQARLALRASDLSMDATMRIGDKLATTATSRDQFEKLMADLFPLGKEVSVKAQNVNQSARTAIRRVYEATEGIDLMLGAQGTAWGAVQAINTWENWGAPIRNASGSTPTELRAERQFDQFADGRQPYTRKAIDMLVSA